MNAPQCSIYTYTVYLVLIKSLFKFKEYLYSENHNSLHPLLAVMFKIGKVLGLTVEIVAGNVNCHKNHPLKFQPDLYKSTL
jgi:hypothetical protein